jgi:hypothetical protein
MSQDIKNQFDAIMESCLLSQQEKEQRVGELVANHVREQLTAATTPEETKENLKKQFTIMATALLKEVGSDENPVCEVVQDATDPNVYHVSYQLSSRVWRLATLQTPDREPKNFIDRYFEFSQEYPDVIGVMMQPGVYQKYVSSTFLNGWINYVEIKQAWLITRYQPHSANKQAVEQFNADPPVHVDLGKTFGDDVLVLAQEEHHPTFWWVFWFDHDVSDCCIGRFESVESEEIIAADFARWAQERSLDMSKDYSGNEGLEENNSGWPASELDVSKFRGWVGFLSH